MKIFRTILLVLCVLVSIFFVVYANIQTELAMQNQMEARKLAEEGASLAKLANMEAANARKAEAEAALLKQQLKECLGTE